MSDEESKPDAKVVDALNVLYVATRTATEQILRLKVKFKVRYRYCRLVEMLHGMLMCGCCHNVQHDAKKTGDCCPCWAIATLHRIEHLGGDADSSLGAVTVTSDVKPAFELVLNALQAVYGAAESVAAVAKSDMPTVIVAGKILCSVDHHIECVEAHIRQIADMNENYLITLV